MPTAVLDKVEGASIVLEGETGGRIVRTGWVEDLNATDGGMALASAVFATNMPARGTAHPAFPNFLLNRIEVTSWTRDYANVALYYEPFGAPIGASYIIELSSTSGFLETNMMPGSKDPFVVKHESDDVNQSIPIPSSYVTMSIYQSVSRLVVTHLRPGAFNVNTAAAFRTNNNKVNSATWFGEKAGAWLITHAGTVGVKYSGYYQTRLEAICRSDDVWSYYGVLQDPHTGRFAAGPYFEQARAALVSRNYTPNSVITTTATNGLEQGIIRVDPYKAIDFSALYGF